MGNIDRRKHIIQASRSKARIAHQASQTLMRRQGRPNHQREGGQSWYQQRKRASQRLRNLSDGQIVLFENGYRGDHRNHWVKNHQCAHVFRVSLRQLAFSDSTKACPFCHPIHDVYRYGSVTAVQEFVLLRSDNKISFSSHNLLGGYDDQYTFGCEIHGFIFTGTFASFISKSRDGDFCHICSY